MAADITGKQVDLTHAVCPMTAVLALVALKELKNDETIVILLRGPDSAANVMETLLDHGYRVEPLKGHLESPTFVNLMVGKV